jgi:hypothetical protein
MKTLKVLMMTFAALMLFHAPASALAAKQAGMVTAVKGDVTVVRAGSGSTGGLEEGDTLNVGDKVMTGERSRIKMLMADDSVLTLGQKATLVIEDYSVDESRGERNSVLKLVAGNLRSIVSKVFGSDKSKFEVHTPTAIAGARGTINIAAVINNDRTLVVGELDDTDVRNLDPTIDGERLLNGRRGCYVDRGMPPGEPFLVGDDVMGQLLGDLSLDRVPRFDPEGEYRRDERPMIEHEGDRHTDPDDLLPPIDQLPPQDEEGDHHEEMYQPPAQTIAY